MPDCRSLEVLLALLRLTAFLPSRCSQVNLLGLAGLHGELVIGTSAIAFWRISGVRFGVVKNEENTPAHVIGVEVYFSLIETFHVVGEWDEEFAIIRDHRPSFSSQSGCPLGGIVGPVTFVGFSTPRVSDLDKFRPSCV